MMPENDNGEWIAEARLAEKLNVPRSTLKAERPYLGPGEVKQDGGAVMWLKKAAVRVTAKLGLAVPASDTSVGLQISATTPAGNDGAAGTVAVDIVQDDGIETLTVFSRPGVLGHHFPNPRVIKAARPDGQIVIVSVMDSRKYTTLLRTGAPMTFRAKKSASGNHWVLVGREPRYPGQW